MRKIYAACLLLGPSMAFAQQSVAPDPSDKIISVVIQDSLRLDSLSLMPGSLQVQHRRQAVDSSDYVYDYSTGYLHFAQARQGDTVEVRYRVLPFSLSAAHFHRSLAVYDSNAFFNEIRYAARQPALQKEELFASPRLTKSGSISRGVSFGNRQNIFVNADLNLQMEGALTDEVNIRAAITDQNIPIQPEGNTQQLQDFDNVFIELYTKNTSLTVGDVVLQHPGGSLSGANRQPVLAVDTNASETVTPHFLRYRRNVQGGMWQSRYPAGNAGQGQTTAGFALAKGRFASVSLAVQEGVQGPYRLKAPENHQYANLSGAATQNLDNAYYLLANSEKVYVDGQLLQRGYDQDYTIDYNLGEITFTNQVLLNRNARVSVDFEYADRSYSRSIRTAGHQQSWERITLYTHFFQEKDNARQSLGFTLTDEEQWQLSQAGDHLAEAYISAADSVGTSEERFRYQNNRQADVPGVGNFYDILYQKKDTLVEGQTCPVYVFHGNGDFKVDFTYVGEGKGNYRQDPSSVNGKVYVWVAPQSGQPQGSYEPVRLLTTPKTRQMLVGGVQASLSAKDQVFGEVAVSRNDLNTFSRLDAADDRGSAAMMGYESKPRKVAFLPKYTWASRLQYEWVHRNFTVADPYRAIEFERRWRVLPYAIQLDSAVQSHDHVLNAHVELQKDAYNRIAYHWAGRKSDLQGVQHTLEVRQSWKRLRLAAQAFHMNNQQPHTNAQWNRLKADVYVQQHKIVPGYTYLLDKNRVAATETDSVLYAAVHFEEHQLYLRSGDSLKNKFRIDYAYRTNLTPWAGEIAKTDINQTVNVGTDRALGENHQLKVKGTYRHTNVVREDVLAQHQTMQEHMVMGQADWRGSFFDNILRADWRYAIANGRELRWAFMYVRVPIGEGNFTWRDDNGNGIEEIEEFYEARYFDERNYVRVYTTTNEYLLAFTNQLDLRLNVQFPQEWVRSHHIKRLAAKFSANTAWNINRKIDDASLDDRLNPWAQTSDEHLLSVRETHRSTLFFNRQDTRLGMEASLRTNRRKQLLYSGFEERRTRHWLLSSRYHFSRMVGLQLETEKSRDYSHLDLPEHTPGSSGRNFLIQTHRASPEISWQPKMNVRVSSRYDITRKQNLPGSRPEAESGGESALMQTVGCELRLSRLLRSTFSATTAYVHIRYTGDASHPVSYEMLEALQPGNNTRWTLSWQQKLLDGLQLTVNYQGRKSPERQAVHAGSMMVKALF